MKVIACSLSQPSKGDGTPDHHAPPRLKLAWGEREREIIMKRIRECIKENLRLLRLQQGWSQEHAAKEYGVTVGQVAKYEDGRNSPEIERLGFICNKVYGVSVDSVMGLKKLIITSEE